MYVSLKMCVDMKGLNLLSNSIWLQLKYFWTCGCRGIREEHSFNSLQPLVSILLSFFDLIFKFVFNEWKMCNICSSLLCNHIVILEGII
jgi:hypothetical protein